LIRCKESTEVILKRLTADEKCDIMQSYENHGFAVVEFRPASTIQQEKVAAPDILSATDEQKALRMPLLIQHVYIYRSCCCGTTLLELLCAPVCCGNAGYTCSVSSSTGQSDISNCSKRKVICPMGFSHGVNIKLICHPSY
jgi:hypothetical protein